jgi:hypothetical protein
VNSDEILDNVNFSKSTNCRFLPLPTSKAQQQIVVASHMKNMIQPLEQAGYAVDIFISYYECGDHAKKVVGWYDQGRARVVSHIAGRIQESYAKKKGAEYANIFMGVVSYDQGYLIGKAAELLKAHILRAKVEYESVLLWRHDFVMLWPFEPNRLHLLRTHRFSAQEDVAYAFPWHLVSAFVHVHGERLLFCCF